MPKSFPTRYPRPSTCPLSGRLAWRGVGKDPLPLYQQVRDFRVSYYANGGAVISTNDQKGRDLPECKIESFTLEIYCIRVQIFSLITSEGT